VDVYISYVDHTTAGGTVGDQQTLITGATTTTVLASPGSSTQRQVKLIIINNTSASSNTIVVKKDIAATEYDLFTVTLGPNEATHYTDGQGWTTYNNQGAVKQSTNQGSAPVSTQLSVAVLNADVTNNNAVANSIADVTGLSFPVVAGTYYFYFMIWYTAAATATGSRWAITGPANSLMGYKVNIPLISTAHSTDGDSGTNSGAYDVPATCNGTSPTQTAGQANIAMIEGMITVTASGDVKARFASEVSNSAIIAKAGSFVQYQKVL
jgi:hypothetical protein